MNLPPAMCLLIADTRHDRFPLVAAQWAALRGMKCWRMDIAATDFAGADLGPNVLLAMSQRTLASFNQAELRALKASVSQGATLYVRGGFPEGQRCFFAPFTSGAFAVLPGRSTASYRLADHALLPQVLRHEVVNAPGQLPAAQLADSAAQPLASAGIGVGELPFIFAMPWGAGAVIYDLMPDEVPAGATTPIVERLAQPAARSFEIGALAAVNHAARRAPATVGAFNLVLDDRPRDFDYFNVANATRWLGHLEQVYPGTHVDFGWSPQYSRPSRRYINALKRFKSGFVWHGLHRHIDHRLVQDPAADYREGLRLVGEIARRYAVPFQPIMILPFQGVNADILNHLNKAGFLAAVFDSNPRLGQENALPEFMRHSTPLHELYLDYLPVLRRYPAPALTRDRMIAHAALDLPIIASAHPFEVGLRRCAALFRPQAPVSVHFDQVAAFAREKGLRSRSLEEIAREMTALPRPTLEIGDFHANLEGIDIAV